MTFSACFYPILINVYSDVCHVFLFCLTCFSLFYSPAWTGRITSTTWSSGKSCRTTRRPGRPRTWTSLSLTPTRCSTGTTGKLLCAQIHILYRHILLYSLGGCLFQRADDGRGGETREEDQGERKSEAARQTSWEPRGRCKFTIVIFQII